MVLLTICLAYFSTLNVQAEHYSETSVNLYHNTWRHIIVESKFHSHRSENLKSVYDYIYNLEYQFFSTANMTLSIICLCTTRPEKYFWCRSQNTWRNIRVVILTSDALALSKGPNWVGVFSPSPENGNRANFRNVVFCTV
jgi:hypothetical protein